MTNNKLAKVQKLPWGADPHRELARLRTTGDAHLVKKQEEDVERRYRFGFRDQLQKHVEVGLILTSTKNATEKETEIRRILADMRHPDSGEIFDRVLTELVKEYEHLVATGQGIVVGPDGKAMAPLTPDIIYQPPDFVGENGKIQSARPMVHPGLATAYAMRSYRNERVENALALVTDDPSLAPAYDIFVEVKPSEIA